MRGQRGATTLEFALILPFFLLVVFMIIELGLAFVAQTMLDNAARDGARQLRIGTLSGTSYATALTAVICHDVTFPSFALVPSCTTNLQLYVAAAASGSPAGTGFKSLKTTTVKGTSMVQSQAKVSANYDVIMQIGYVYPWSLPGLSLITGSTLMMSTIAFQTEPY
ncbi:MAG TPA: TadE/TadG family type IV pilus assembly protein [Paraburkholderia sp.]|jgi:Flp pilus assembly protein TadG